MGLPLVDFDVALSAVTYNLRRLGSVLRQQPELWAARNKRRTATRPPAFLCLLLATLRLPRRRRCC